MKQLVLAILGLIVISNVSAQTKTNNIGPAIKFEKLSHDFGTIEESLAPAIYKFRFTNEGDSPLLLQKVAGSCECTKPEYPTKPIMPGESEFITVGYKTSGHDGGSFSKTITVVTNAPQDSKTKIVFLTIKGIVKKKANS